jgi:hypothetical protein
MNTPRMTSQFVQRTSKGLAMAALAFGLVASVVAPHSVYADSLTRPKPVVATYFPDLVPVTFGAAVHADGTFGMVAQAKNQGGVTASTAALKFELPTNLYDIRVQDSGNYSCFIAGYTVMCTLNRGLPAGDKQGVAIVARAFHPGTYPIRVTADPNDLVSEANETNNQTTVAVVIP